jgi:hypothetical protein
MFFSEEKNQKTFIFSASPLSDYGRDLSVSAITKVFCFFSSEKKAFLPCFRLLS